MVAQEVVGEARWQSATRWCSSCSSTSLRNAGRRPRRARAGPLSTDEACPDSASARCWSRNQRMTSKYSVITAGHRARAAASVSMYGASGLAGDRRLPLPRRPAPRCSPGRPASARPPVELATSESSAWCCRAPRRRAARRRAAPGRRPRCACRRTAIADAGPPARVELPEDPQQLFDAVAAPQIRGDREFEFAGRECR